MQESLLGGDGDGAQGRSTELVNANQDADDVQLSTNDGKPIPKTLWGPLRIIGAIGALSSFLIFVYFVEIETPTHDEFLDKFKGANFERVNRCFAVLVPMVFMWLFNVIDPFITGMFPMVFMPMMGIANSKAVGNKYIDSNAELFIGLFMVSTAMEACNLHRRIALFVLNKLAYTPKTFYLGFMLPPFFLSFISSNAGSTALMLPIAMASMEATIRNAREKGDAEEVKNLMWYEKGLYMAISYSATVGGVTTIVATAPNTIVATEAEDRGYPSVTFGQWMGAFILLGIFLQCCNFLIMFSTYGRGVKSVDRVFIEREWAKINGPLSRDEKWVLFAFTVMLAWMVLESVTSKLLWGTCTVKKVADYSILTAAACADTNGKWKGTFQLGSIGIICGMFLFLIPSVIDKRRNLLTWKLAKNGIPWGLLMLLGAGNALSLAFSETSTTIYISTFLEPLGKWGLFPLALVTTTIVACLTELASNTATTRILMPIFIQFANDNNRHPLLVGLPCALAASMAFMLPIATPTNAVALGSGKIEFTDFVRAGWKMNLIGIALVTLFVCTTGNWVFGLDDPVEGFQKDWVCKREGSNITCPTCFVFASCVEVALYPNSTR